MKTVSLMIGGVCYTLDKIENKNGSALRLHLSKPGQAKPYVVTYNPNANNDSEQVGWSCGCLGWCNKRGSVRKCKHLKAIADHMASIKAVA